MASSLVLNRSRKVPAQETVAFGAIAERFRRAGALDKAVSLCREGLKKFPDHVSARVTLGWALLDLGQYDEARTELELVLRRAPDNLAAIRGLAELHDRFEHTLNLPMDGPGQWPPPASEVEDFVEAPIVAAAEPAFDVAHSAVEAPMSLEAEEGKAVMVPADMGMPIWSQMAAAPAPAVASTSPASREPVAAPMTTATIPSAPMPSSGMSSVREIDFPATASVAAPASLAAPVDAEVDVAALIAEAESLEAAAEAAVATSEFEAVSLDPAPAVDLVADVELNPNEDLAAQLHLSAGAELESESLIESDLPVTIELAVTDGAQEFDQEFAELAADVPADLSGAPEPLALGASEFVEVLPALSESTAEVVDEVLAGDETTEFPAAGDVVDTPVVEAVEAADAAPAIAAVEAVVAPEAVAPAVVTSAETVVVADVVAADETAAVAEADAAAAVPSEFANVLAFAPAGSEVAPHAAVRTARTHPALPALERMLAKVQARRLQLMAESVA